MRRHSLTGPLLLLLIGCLFLWKNLHPEARIFDLFSVYWPFLLIAWGLMRLVEALIWTRQGYRPSLTGGEIVLIVLICIVGSGVWQARKYGVHFETGGLDLWGQQYDYPISASASAAGVDRIVFENPRGNIKITGGDTTAVQVAGRKMIRSYGQSEADRTNESTPLELVPQGNTLLVRTNQDRAPDNQRISDDLEVTVPRGIAVEARGNYGDYEIDGVTGDVHLATEHGDARLSALGGSARLEIGHSDLIRAAGVKGSLELQGEGSDIDLEDIAGQVTINGAYRGSLEFKNLAQPLQLDGIRDTELRVAAVPGEIDMDLGQFTAHDIVGPARLVTRSRDVTVDRFTASLDLETDRGDVELTPGRLPLPAIDARSGSGRIDLALPPGAAFTLEATAEKGDAVNDYGAPIQKEVDGRTSKLAGKAGNGPIIRLSTDRGEISVHKEGVGPGEPPPPPKTPAKPAKGSEI